MYHLLASRLARRADVYRPQTPLELQTPYIEEDWKRRLRGYYSASPEGWQSLSSCLEGLFSVRRRSMKKQMDTDAFNQDAVDMSTVESLDWQQLYIPFEPPTAAVHKAPVTATQKLIAVYRSITTCASAFPKANHRYLLFRCGSVRLCQLC